MSPNICHVLRNLASPTEQFQWLTLYAHLWAFFERFASSPLSRVPRCAARSTQHAVRPTPYARPQPTPHNPQPWCNRNNDPRRSPCSRPTAEGGQPETPALPGHWLPTSAPWDILTGAFCQTLPGPGGGHPDGPLRRPRRLAALCRRVAGRSGSRGHRMERSRFAPGAPQLRRLGPFRSKGYSRELPPGFS
jgi:hypothetical protein